VVLLIETIPEPVIDGLIIRLQGAAVVDHAEQLEKSLTAALAKHPANVVLDLRELAIITSLCIGKLVVFRKGVISGAGTKTAAGQPVTVAEIRGDRENEAVHGRVVIAGAKEGVSRSMKFTRLDELFELFPTVESAVKALKA
jgi:anti-anti-sigma regulatory factor